MPNSGAISLSRKKKWRGKCVQNYLCLYFITLSYRALCGDNGFSRLNVRWRECFHDSKYLRDPWICFFSEWYMAWMTWIRCRSKHSISWKEHWVSYLTFSLFQDFVTLKYVCTYISRNRLYILSVLTEWKAAYKEFSQKCVLMLTRKLGLVTYCSHTLKDDVSVSSASATI